MIGNLLLPQLILGPGHIHFTEELMRSSLNESKYTPTHCACLSPQPADPAINTLAPGDWSIKPTTHHCNCLLLEPVCLLLVKILPIVGYYASNSIKGILHVGQIALGCFSLLENCRWLNSMEEIVEVG
jgi:hypothetical protein